MHAIDFAKQSNKAVAQASIPWKIWGCEHQGSVELQSNMLCIKMKA